MTDASPAAKSASRADGFPLLDSIRAIAALSIVAYHSASAADAPATTFTSRLNTGVNLFFLLSAFLLYRPFVRARLRCERVPSVSRYGWRRFLRIVPAYWVALTVAALVFSQRDTFGHHGLLYFGFGQIYAQQTALGGLLVAWSLCVEVTLYAFLPLWAFTMRLRRPVDTRGRFRMELLGILALLAFSIVFKATYVNANQAGGAGLRLAQALPRYMDAFA